MFQENLKSPSFKASPSDAFKSDIQVCLDDMWMDENSDYDAFRIVYKSEKNLEELKKQVAKLPFKKLVILGMGASMLNPMAVIQGGDNTQKKITFVSHLDETVLDHATEGYTPYECGFLIISKSGSTLETTTFALLARKWILEKNLIVADHLVMIKGSGDSQLTRLADHDHLKYQFDHPHIGGRFAIFTNVTLVPGIFAGLDMELFLKGGMACLEDAKTKGCESAVGHGVQFYLMSKQGGRNLNIFESFVPAFSSFGEWWCQLWAESLGKNPEAVTPVNSSGPLDHHSQWQLYLSAPQNKVITFMAPLKNPEENVLADVNFAEKIGAPHFAKFGLSDILSATFYGAKSALAEKDIPYAVWEMDENQSRMYNLGYIMMHTFLVILAVGRITKCDPFGQPAVEALKIAAKEFMNTKRVCRA